MAMDSKIKNKAPSLLALRCFGMALSSSKAVRVEDGKVNEERKWCDLPRDVLATIAGKFGIIDLLSFRSVCKDWKVASEAASAEIESSPSKEPWFLLYGEEDSSQCLLLSDTDERYTINIPQLNASTSCIASNKGWLLLFQEEDNSIYFFCPFSRAKIQLPELNGLASFSNYLATFSSPPTSKDCFVSIICRNGTSSETIQLYLVKRGEKEWKSHSCTDKEVGTFDKFNCVAYYEDELSIMDSVHQRMLVYSFNSSRWNLYTIVTGNSPALKPIPFSSTRNYFRENDTKRRLGLEGNVRISICGSAFTRGDYIDRVIFGETFHHNNPDDTSPLRTLKGVWIHPRFFLLPSNLTYW